jgi:plasmid stability protein
MFIVRFLVGSCPSPRRDGHPSTEFVRGLSVRYPFAIMIAKGVAMAQVIVRNLEDAVKRKLQRRAARHGRSMEEEIRDILRDAVKDEGKPRKGLGTEIAELFKGIELDEPIEEFRGFDIKPPKF